MSLTLCRLLPCLAAFVTAVMVTVTTAPAQTLDTTFDPNVNGTVFAAVPLTDGKILIGGSFTQVGGVERNRLARLHSNGTLDLTFDPNVTGFSDPPLFPTDSSEVDCLLVQADGKILLGGNFTHIGGKPQGRLARLHPDGTLDTTFIARVSEDRGNGVIDRTSVDTIAQRDDGKLIIGGSFSNVAGQTSHKCLARLNANGSLDTSFSAQGTGVNTVHDLEVLPNGQIVVSGQFSSSSLVLKLNADGSQDTGFPIASVQGSPHSLIMLPDGKILIGGSFSNINGSARNSLARLQADGSLDTGFTPTRSGSANLALLADGDIVTHSYHQNADGSVISDFPLLLGGLCQGISIQKNGQILIYGSFTTVGGIPRSKIARLTPAEVPAENLTASSSTGDIQWLRSGSAPALEKVTFDVWDNAGLSWVPCGKATAISGGWQITGQTLPSSSWIRARARVQGGAHTGSSWMTEQISSYGRAVAELEVEAAGTGILTDNQNTLTFGTGAWLVPGSSKVLTLRNTGTADLTNISVAVTGQQAGDFGITGPGTAILAPGGSTTFTITFTAQGGSVREGTLLISSNDADERPFRVALTGTGVHEDPTFNLDLDGAYVEAATQHPDGRILLAGYVESIGSSPVTDLAWVNNGGLASIPFEDSLRTSSTAMMPDGKLLTTQAGYLYTRTVKRWHSNGTADFSFIGRSEMNGGKAMVIYPTGEIIAALSLKNTTSNEYSGGFYHYSADGSQVNPQNMGVGSQVSALALQEDGRYLVGGYFTTPDNKKSLVRYLENQNRDTSFMSAGSSWFSDLAVNALAIQPDGKILIGGPIQPVSGIIRQGIARLNSDGSLDMGFAPLVNGDIHSMILQADGKIIISGLFTSVNGSRRNNIARLYPDGSLDPQFDPDANNEVNGLSLQKDGNILASGRFTELGSVSRNYVARLPNNISASESLTVTGTAQIQWLRGGSAPEISHVIFESWDGSAWAPLGRAIRVPGGWNMSGLSLPARSWVRARGRAYGGLHNGSSYLVEQVVSYGGSLPNLVVERPSGTALETRAQVADFGGVLVNATSSAITYTLRNTGTQALAGLSVAKSGPNSSNFTASNLATTLAPGSSTTLTVTFTPKALGQRFAHLQIQSNDPDSSPFEIFLKGTGLNNAPTITGLTDLVMNEDEFLQAVPFTVGDVETPAADLTVYVTSSNTNLISSPLSDSGTGTARTFGVYPKANQHGTSTLTVHVGDGITTTSVPVTLTVRSVNDLPTITGLTAQSIDEDTSTGPLAFTLADVETPAEDITLTATSNSTGLIPHANIVFGGSGASRTVTVTPLPNQNGSALITIRAHDGTGSRTATFNVTVNPVPDSPVLNSIANQVTDEDTPLAVPVHFSDPDLSLGSLSLTATSGNTTLVLNAGLAFTSTGYQRTLTITPVTNRSGTADITVRLSDGLTTVAHTFQLTVNPVNDAPAISAIAAQMVNENTSTGAIPFTVQDVESAAATLSVTASSDNTALIPPANLLLGGTGVNRTLTITPAQDQSGSALITLTVGDGTATTTSSFTLTVANLLTITQHPLSTQVGEGQELRLSVTATGTGPLTYQWRKSEVPIPLATASEWIVPEALLSDQGSYDVIVTNPAGSVPSESATVAVHRQPTIQQQPLSQVIQQGSPLELEVSALGLAPMTYQWKKGKTSLTGASGTRHTVTNSATTSHAGSYSVAIAGPGGNAESASAHIAVVAPAPANLSVKKGGVIKLTSKVTAPKAAGVSLTYRWQKGSAALTDGRQENGALVSGSGTATLSISQADLNNSGEYSCLVTLNTPGNSPAAAHSSTQVTVVDQVPVIEEVTLPGTLLISEPVEAEIFASHAPKSYSAVGLPKGLVLNSSTGRITGRPVQAGRYDPETNAYSPFKVRFYARNDVGQSLAREFYLTVEKNSFEGSYVGVVKRDLPTNGDFGGRLDLTVTSTGIASGSLQTANQRYAFKMALDTSFAEPQVFQASVLIPRKKPFSTPLRLTLNAAGGFLSGSLQEVPSGPESGAALAPILVRLVTPPASVASGMAGDYTLGFHGTGPLAEGFARLKVSTNGAAQWTGRAGDGSTFTCSSKLASAPDTVGSYVLLYTLLDKDQGSLQGAVTLHPGHHDILSLAGAEVPMDCLLHPRPEGSRDLTFSQGVPVRTIRAVGNKYSKEENFDNFLEPAGLVTDSARLSFLGRSDPDVSAFGQNFILRAPSRIILPKLGDLNPNGVSLTLSPTTGLYSGRYKDPVTGRSGSFNGVLVHHYGSDENRGFGQFVFPLGTARDPVHVGTVQLLDLKP